MRFGHFSHVWGKSGMNAVQRYQQLWRELQLCDELGFDYGFCVEHHFRPDESWMPAPNLYAVAAGSRTRRIRLGAMGHVVPLHHPIRLAEEIAVTDHMLEGRLEVALVPGIVRDYFGPYGADYASRRDVTMEFVHFLKTCYTDSDHFDFAGRFHQFRNVKLAINPIQCPHPPLWIETRDPPTLSFCAEHGINTGYFFLFDRPSAAPRYRSYLAQWRRAGWTHVPNIAYSTAIYVDETDKKALERGLNHAGRAYRGFLPATEDAAELKRFQAEFAQLFEERGEPRAAETIRHLVDPEYLLANDLILVGSPDTVASKLKDWAVEGVFNTFLGEFNVGDLPEEDLLRSIRLFGTEVLPRLRGLDPF